MTASLRIRSSFLAGGVALCLACAGALDAVAPEPPVPPPADATTTSVNTSFNNGTSSTTIGYDTDAKPADVIKHYKRALGDADWKVKAKRTDGGGTLTATKDPETFVVTVQPGSFETVWTKR